MINFDLSSNQPYAGKALVAIKKVLNPNAKLKTINLANGGSIIDPNGPSIINPYDEAALTAALALKAKGALTELIAVNIGIGGKELLIQSLAKGVDRAILLQTEHSLSPLNVAKILKAIIVENNITLAFLGKQAIDDDCQQTGAMLAGLLGWPQATAVTNIELTAESELFALTVTKEVEQGSEILQLKLPAVLTIDLHFTENSLPKYLTLAQLLQAKTKPLEVLELETYTQNLTNLDLRLNLENIKILNTTIDQPVATNMLEITDVNELLNKLRYTEQVLA